MVPALKLPSLEISDAEKAAYSEADVHSKLGYVEKLPFRKPADELQQAVVERVETIIERLQANPEADVTDLRSEIDDRIFDLFDIHSSRQQVLDFYAAVGRVESSNDPAGAPAVAATDVDQAASE